MNIVDMNKFEQKLREAEERLGIRPESRVPVVYERNSDTAGKLLASIIVGGLILAILTRSKSFRSPISMDAFVRPLFEIHLKILTAVAVAERKKIILILFTVSTDKSSIYAGGHVVERKGSQVQ
jgi:hypothetical protein